MKIAFVIHEMTAGGAERVISVLANKMTELGCSVTVLMTAGNRIEYDLNRAVKVIQVGQKSSGNLWILFKRVISLRKIIYSENFDAIIAFEADTGLYTLLANCFRKNNVYISERSNPDRYPKPILRSIAYYNAKRVIFQTESARRYFGGKIKKNGIVISNPLQDNLPNVYEGDREKKIVSVGRLREEKNFLLLIDAFNIFKDSNPGYSLQIYGKGLQHDELQAKIIECGLETRVSLEGFHSDVAELISSASMFVMTSDYEGMPNALMEAMALGLPVISTDCPIGGPRNLINDGENGLLVGCGDAKAIAIAMCRLVDDPEFAKKLGKEASKVREKYDAEAICNQWIKAIS